MFILSLPAYSIIGSIVIEKGIQKVRLPTRAQLYIRTQLEATQGPMMMMCPISVIFEDELIRAD